ncbi:MAG: sigma-54 interaction domain-containing protein, partial [Planctomycetaceae bacterium]
AQSDETAAVVSLCERLLREAVEETGEADEFLGKQLPALAAELSAQWVAVMHCTPQWEKVAECGRQPLPQLPFDLLAEALDRERAVVRPSAGPPGGALVIVPLTARSLSGSVLLLAGRSLAEDALPAALAAGRALSVAMDTVASLALRTRWIDRLQAILEIASSFANIRESGPLLELMACEATRLLDCDRASIFIWDREHKQVVACPALGMESGTLRLPDGTGIVGQVIHSGRTVRVDDAYNDTRFDRSVDRKSGYVTRNLLCVPMRDGEGTLIGAFEVINKNQGTFSPEDEESVEQLALQAAIAIQNTREREQLLRSQQQLTEEVTSSVRIIGESPAIVALRETVRRLAATDLPVLILGESGTGKEVVARALHFQGPRAPHPFVAVNCAALTETLLESELFGHERGAFTDARETRQGKFELAEGGTLFLDEIGDMSLNGQAKLLRVLEQKVVTRVGGSQAIPINVRIIAATNTILNEAVRNKRFREDLYYRLSVVTQTLPPLRERPEDILILAEYFLKQFCVQASRPPLHISADARRRLQSHAWPGNVRELRNLMERVAFLCHGERVEVDDLAFILSPERDSDLEPSLDFGLNEATREFQREFIRRAVKRVGGNMSEAARLLGLHRSNLYRKLRHLDM